MKGPDKAKRLLLFAMANQMVELDLDRIESEHAVDLRRGIVDQSDKDQTYYPQIEQAIRAEAASMAPHYEVFYSLERTIRLLISETLESGDGPQWWSGSRVPAKIVGDVATRQAKELDMALTPRSHEPLDFCTFGELGEIIRANWDVFGGIFSSTKGVDRVMTLLNSIRGPIAHCSPLAEDEVVRLRLAVRDWFRLME